MVAIGIDSVTKVFAAAGGGAKSAPAVDAVSLTIPSGSLFFLLGPSGCGKTTLLRMIAGFTVPTAGRILFGDQDMSQVPAHQRDTGMVFQSYALWPHMTVAENVAFGLNVRKIRNPERTGRIHDALALVQMDQLKDRRPNQLSGGQQQRVALARALAIRPTCLLLDEPLSNLDAKLRLEMRGEIRRIVKSAGITAVYVTHDQKEALSMADTIAVMNKGRLEQVGTPAELYRRPATRFVADFIGESNFIPGTIQTVSSTTLLIKTPAGPIMAAAPTGGGRVFVPGTTVMLAIRPEAVILDGVSQEGAGGGVGVTVNRLGGKRVSSTYLGEMAEHLVALPGLAEPLKAFEMNPRAAPPGPEITVQIPADQVMLVDEAVPST